MESRRHGAWILFFIVIISGCLGLQASAIGTEADSKDNLPITITSGRMDGDFKTGVISFSGEVKVVRGELVVRADQVDVYPKDKGKDIDRIVATGNVRVLHGTRSSISERAEFVEEAELLILSGAAKVSDGKNTIAGPLIRVYLDEDRVEVEGNTAERPTFLFHPETIKSQDIDGQ